MFASAMCSNTDSTTGEERKALEYARTLSNTIQIIKETFDGCLQPSLSDNCPDDLKDTQRPQYPTAKSTSICQQYI